MAILTLNAYPATKTDSGSHMVEITKRLANEQAEVVKAQDCIAQFEAFVRKHGPELAKSRGVMFSAYIREGHGRKPSGYNAIKPHLDMFVAQKVAAPAEVAA